jgi:hypothetical protein
MSAAGPVCGNPGCGALLRSVAVCEIQGNLITANATEGFAMLTMAESRRRHCNCEKG